MLSHMFSNYMYAITSRSKLSDMTPAFCFEINAWQCRRLPLIYASLQFAHLLSCLSSFAFIEDLKLSYDLIRSLWCLIKCVAMYVQCDMSAGHLKDQTLSFSSRGFTSEVIIGCTEGAELMCKMFNNAQYQTGSVVDDWALESKLNSCYLSKAQFGQNYLSFACMWWCWKTPEGLVKNLLLFGSLLRQKHWVNVGQHPTSCDGYTAKELRQLLIIANC